MSTLADELSFSPLFTKLLEKLGFQSPEETELFIRSDLGSLHDPFLMKGMTEAVSHLKSAIQNQEKILIHGDYDVDGVTATTVLCKLIGELGGQFEAFLPERVRDGYGVSERAIREAKDKGITLLITADCGITAHKEMQLASDLGIDTIIIDHHKIPSEGIPKATVILNPQQEDCTYPFKELSAAGLAFKLAQALLDRASYALLDLAALSTVCDVAPLLGENRIIVKEGLNRLSREPSLGLKVLSHAAKIKTAQFNVGHLGFILGPRINACGRMSTPDMALRLLLSGNQREAESLATALESENRERQREERQTTKEAIHEVERKINFNRDRVIIVGREGWHQGVVGIVASRLVDRFHRPAVVIAFKNGVGKGSGRSIKGFNLHEVMQSCSGLMDEFGGHAQAIGLSMQESRLTDLRRSVNEYARENVPADVYERKVKFDLEIELSELTSVFIKELPLLEPHGVGNPRPIFKTENLKIKGTPKRLSPKSLQFWVTDGMFTCEAKWSPREDDDPTFLIEDTSVTLYYSVKVKTWQGRDTLSLDVKTLQN